MINKVTLIGNLGRDPEIRHFEGGSKVTKFSVATNENYQDKAGQWQTRTEWHEVVLWGNQAERAEKTLRKGNLVYIEGKLSTRKWQDKDGNDRYTTEIVANYYRALEKRESGVTDGDASSYEFDDRKFQSSITTDSNRNSPSEMPEEDDLPF